MALLNHEEARDTLILEDVTKRFRKVLAVDRLSVAIRGGELFTILGPSGCGKTTALRLIAGLERPDRGEIFHRQQPIVSVRKGIFVEPDRRRMGMVFQTHAVWPHMTLFDNVAYPLRLRRLSQGIIKDRVTTILRLVGLDGIEDRPAPLLSGGQQQRVALARALVYEPDLLLLDEPFSNLDAKLRQQMGVELKVLQARLGVTAIYVTHDQVEALALSDRIAVMNNGRVEQVDTPRDLYERPRTPFVRDFVGRTVVLEATVRGRKGQRAEIELIRAGGVVVEAMIGDGAGVSVGDRVRVAIRPEDIAVPEGATANGGGAFEGAVESLVFVGDRMECQLRVGEERVLVYVPRARAVCPGSTLTVCLPPDVLTLWRN